MSFKKKLSLITGIFMVAIFTVTTTQVKAAEYTWRLAHEELADGFMDSVAHEFGRLLSEKSNGKIELQIFPSGTLGTSEDLVELTQQNAVHFNFADAGHLGSQIPEVQALLLQYIFPKDLNIVKNVLQNGNFKKELDPKFQAKKLEPLCYLTQGWQVWTTNKEIRTPDNFKGFKMRTMTSKLIVENYKAFDANPTPTPYSEVYSALQLNMVDGQENPLNCIEDMKFYEVQDYLIFAYTNPFVLTFIANKKFYDGLPSDVRDIVYESAQEIIEFSFEWQDKFNAEKLKSMTTKKPGLKVLHLTEQEIAKFKELAEPVRNIYYDMAGKNGEKLLKTLEQDIAEASAN